MTILAVIWVILSGLAINEFSELSPWAARKVARWSARVRYTEPARAEARSEELEALIEARPGKLLKLITALCFAASAIRAWTARAMTPMVGPHTAPPADERAAATGGRAVGIGLTSLGIPIGIGAADPLLGSIMAAIELVVALAIIGTALFGSQAPSERAFRLLRWIANRPEPPAPADSGQPPTAQ